MPKLDLIHIAERLKARLEELKAGKEVAAREIRALLNEEQLAAMDAAWTEQQALRKKRKARTKKEEKALGWKTKREIFIEAYELALADAEGLELDAWDKRQSDAEIRQAKVYLGSYFKAQNEGKTKQVATNIANNDLTRAGLRRMDSKTVNHLSKRDKEVAELEANLKKQLGIEEE